MAEVIYTITDPPLKALRRVIPPLRLGSITLDLSFLVLVVLVQIAIYLASCDRSDTRLRRSPPRRGSTLRGPDGG